MSEVVFQRFWLKQIFTPNSFWGRYKKYWVFLWGPPIVGPPSHKLPIPVPYFNGFLWEWYGSSMGTGVPLLRVPGIFPQKGQFWVNHISQVAWSILKLIRSQLGSFLVPWGVYTASVQGRLGGGFKYIFDFHSWEKWSSLTWAYFSNGWLNHQLVLLYTWIFLLSIKICVKNSRKNKHLHFTYLEDPVGKL